MLVILEDMEKYPYNIGYYDLSIKPYTYTKVYDAEETKEIYENDGTYLEFNRMFSSDVTKLYVFALNPEKYEYFIKTLSLESKEVIKETKFNISNYLPTEYIRYSGLLNDNTLVLLDRFNIYFIDL